MIYGGNEVTIGLKIVFLVFSPLYYIYIKIYIVWGGDIESNRMNRSENKKPG